jgi:2-polyprenyl-3-methyl-5-hydroxy-6-metoxy-1,4-benzoquinol methylase
MSPDSMWNRVGRLQGRIRRRIRRRTVLLADVVTNSRRVRLNPPGPTSYFLPRGYRYRVVPRYYSEKAGQPFADLVAQPDVYLPVEKIADVLESYTIVDLGCGRGGKLERLSGRFEIVGADFGSNLDFCRDTYEWGTWVEADLESGALALEPVTYRRAVLVSSDVIEHLANPEHLLSTIASLLDTAAAAVLSAPDRVRTRGAKHMGPPGNLCHVREWSMDEFRQLLEQSGLRVAHMGYTRSNTLDREGRTILAVCAGAALEPEQVELAARAARQVSAYAFG